MMFAKRQVERKIRSIVLPGSLFDELDNMINHISMKTLLNLFLAFPFSLAFCLLSFKLKKTRITESLNCRHRKKQLRPTHMYLISDLFSINQNHPQKQLTTKSETQSGPLKHLKIAIHSGIFKAFGAIMQSLSK